MKRKRTSPGVLRTVSDLRHYLESQGLSPETLAERAHISNMTIRRMVRKPPATRIPEKYHLQLDHALGIAPLADDEVARMLAGGEGDFAKLLCELEKDGRAYDRGLGELKRDVSQKLKEPGVTSGIRHSVKTVLTALSAKGIPMRQKMLALGAILYFVNPIDLIPDAIPVAGYLDDFGVLAIVTAILARWQREHGGAAGGDRRAKAPA